MKITDATMEIYRWDRPVPIRNGMYTYPTVALNLIKLETDEGITGYGYMGGEHVTDDMTMGTFNNMKQFVIGQDPFDNERLWDAMWQPKLVGRRGTSTRAISGIDIALWDIKGKATDTSVHKLLGAYTDRIPVYIAGGYYEEGKGLNELAAEMETAVEMGSNAVKMKDWRRAHQRGCGAHSHGAGGGRAGCEGAYGRQLRVSLLRGDRAGAQGGEVRCVLVRGAGEPRRL